MTRLSDCQAALKTAKANLATCQTNVANLKTQVADLQAQLDALQPPPPPPPPPPSGRWYSDASPFNNPVHTGPHPNSAAIISRIRGQGTFTKEHWGQERTRADFSHPFYFATSSDPVLTLHPGFGNSWMNLNGDKIHVPLAARPAGGSDGSMTVVQPDGWEYNLWLAQIPNVPSGEQRCGFAKKVRHDGTGLQETGDVGGITAAGFANGLGVIRLDELKAGVIPHALFIAVNGWHLRCYPGQSGGQHSGETADTNAPNMGALLQLNIAESEIKALGGPAWKQAVWVAMAEFGMYVGDQSGSVIALQTESDVAAMALGLGTPGADWCKSVGLPSGTQQLFDVDKQATVARVVYTMDWTAGMDWSKLRVLQAPSP